MRLSAELLGTCEQRTNPLGERELVLRGLAIPAIEHLGATLDAFDCFDLSENRLGRLDNFPRLLRLSSLLLAGNLIESLDATNLGKNIPNLTFLELDSNQISSLWEISNLGKACTKLEHLNLRGNPITRRQHYRLYTIKNIPSLKVLDYVKISKTERERAERLAQSAAGAALEADVQGEQSSSSTSTTNAKTFIPGEGLDTQKTFTAIFTAEEKEWIRDLVANASSPAEIEEIELSVQRGILPPQLANRKRSADRDSGGGGETADDPPTKKIRNGHS